MVDEHKTSKLCSCCHEQVFFPSDSTLSALVFQGIPSKYLLNVLCFNTFSNKNHKVRLMVRSKIPKDISDAERKKLQKKGQLEGRCVGGGSGERACFCVVKSIHFI